MNEQEMKGWRGLVDAVQQDIYTVKIFSSETAAILAADAVIKRIDVEGMADRLERLIGDGESADGIARALRDYLMEGKP